MLGGYNPVPRHEWAPLINQYLGIWDQLLAARFEQDQPAAPRIQRGGLASAPAVGD
jgi:hypothetical protein